MTHVMITQPNCNPWNYLHAYLPLPYLPLFKLLYLGRDYPKGATYFKERLKHAFMKNKDVTDPEKIRTLVKRGDFVIKELEALYFLRKYRTMKHRYYNEHEKWLTIGLRSYKVS